MTIKIGVLPSFSDYKLSGNVRIKDGVVEVQLINDHLYSSSTREWKKAEDHEICVLPASEEHVISWDDMK